MSKTAVLAFCRMQPPTAGHELIVNTIADQQGDPYLYLSHSHDSSKNPLDYETKVMWCKKAFGHKVNVVNSQAKNMYEAAAELNKQGYTDLIYVCGSDRAEEAARMRNYNGKADKNGNIIYNFDSINFITAGGKRINEDDLPVEAVSASKQREFAASGDLEDFIKYCPSALADDECEELYNDVRKGMGLFESLDELHEGENMYELDEWLNKLKNIKLDEENAGEKFERDVTQELDAKDKANTYDFERQGSSLVSDIKCEKIGSKKVFFVECKQIPAQAGEIRCAIKADGSLERTESGYKIADDDLVKQQLHQDDSKIMNEIVDAFNSKDYLKSITAGYKESQIDINITKLDQLPGIDSEDAAKVSELVIKLMKDRIISHYKFLGADYIAIGRDAKSARFCRLEDVWDVLSMPTLKLRQKLEFSYSVDPVKYSDIIGKFINSHFKGILKEPLTDIDINKYGFIQGYDNRLLFYSTSDDGVIPSNAVYDKSCEPNKGGHIKCIMNGGDLAFDITPDREHGKREGIDDFIEVKGKEYHRFAIRMCPNRAIISFLATVDKRKDSSKDMSYEEFLKVINNK